MYDQTWKCYNLWKEHNIFSLLFISIINRHISYKYFLTHRLEIFFHAFISKNTDADKIISNFGRDFISLKSRFLVKSLATFLILPEIWSAECKYLMKCHLKHSLLLEFWILIKTFLDGLIFLVVWYNCNNLRACTLKH